MTNARISRRSLIASAATLLPNSGLADVDIVSSVVPTADAGSISIAVRLRAPATEPLEIEFDGARARAADAVSGQHFTFKLENLRPDRRYKYRLWLGRRAVTRAYTITTLPSPESSPERLRVLLYTCAGGHAALRDARGKPLFLPLEQRIQLLEAGLAQRPDLVVANGDHIYWVLDGRFRAAMSESEIGRGIARLDRAADPSTPPNLVALDRLAAPQISDLYGDRLAEVPSFFLPDDHDYFENDEAAPGFTTFPPDAFHSHAATLVQRMFYPRPAGTSPGIPAGSSGVTEVNWGRLASLVLYDCRRNLNADRSSGYFVPPSAERWIRRRDNRGRWRGHVPSTPMGWTAGKWAEWYGDSNDGVEKPYWSPAWRQQHDRLLQSLAARAERGGFLAQGDLHASAAALIGLREDRLVPAFLCGTLATGESGFPSSARGATARAPSGLVHREVMKPVEQNGFAILDLTPSEGQLTLFVRDNAGGVQEATRMQIPRI